MKLLIMHFSQPRASSSLFIWNTDAETSWKMSICKIEKEMEDNIKTDNKGIDFEVRRWMELVQGRVH
jgi:hypothetical protein